MCSAMRLTLLQKLVRNKHILMTLGQPSRGRVDDSGCVNDVLRTVLDGKDTAVTERDQISTFIELMFQGERK